MRNLAHIELIEDVRPVRLKEGAAVADSIEIARVLGWWVVVKKGEYKPGDKTVYIEIDSLVPASNEAFDFLASKNYKVKTMKLNKFYYNGDSTRETVISQGLCMPLSILPAAVQIEATVGKDVTEALGITKLEDETPEVRVKVDKSTSLKRLAKTHWLLKRQPARWLMRFKWFRAIVTKLLVKVPIQKAWPSYIAKTDETRIQANPHLFELLRDAKETLEATEKLDGTSSTYGLQKTPKGFDFAVCSRNVRQLDRDQKTYHKEAESNVYWEMADKYNIENVLHALFSWTAAKDHVILQGETIGPSIQGNKYQLKERELRIFNLIVDGRKYGPRDGRELLNSVLFDMQVRSQGPDMLSMPTENISEEENALQWVPILHLQFRLPETLQELISHANGSSTLLPSTLREGIVFRTSDGNTSFKVISNDFLLKWGL